MLRQENCLNPGGRGCSERCKITPLHSSLGDRVRLHLKKQTNKRKEAWGVAQGRLAGHLGKSLRDVRVGQSKQKNYMCRDPVARALVDTFCQTARRGLYGLSREGEGLSSRRQSEKGGLGQIM